MCCQYPSYVLVIQISITVNPAGHGIALPVRPLKCQLTVSCRGSETSSLASGVSPSGGAASSLAGGQPATCEMAVLMK